VIAATGVWTDELRALAFGQTEPRLRPSKGVHLVVDAARLRLAHAGFLPAPERGRFVFLIPWGERAIVGTTDADHAGGLDAPHATPDDVRYLLDVVNRWTDADLSPADVVSTYAGLRPLVAGRAGASADLSRGHRVAEEGDGLVTIIGGKLTTYRRMARDAVDAVADRLGASRAPATDRHVLVGGAMPTGADLRALRDRAADLRLPMGALRQALWGHGAETARLLDRIRANPALASPLSEGLPWTVADAAVAVSDEAALTVEDVLMRRTKVGLQARDGGVSAVSAVALLLGLDPAAERAAWAARVAAERARWAGPAEPAR
jgi:glycerol-3-phosphate dehydrogenase